MDRLYCCYPDTDHIAIIFGTYHIWTYDNKIWWRSHYQNSGEKWEFTSNLNHDVNIFNEMVLRYVNWTALNSMWFSDSSILRILWETVVIPFHYNECQSMLPIPSYLFPHILIILLDCIQFTASIIDSLALGRTGCLFKNAIFNLFLLTGTFRSFYVMMRPGEC